MQKIVLKDNTEISNVTGLVAYIKTINKDEREVLEITLEKNETNTLENILEIFKSENKDNYSSIKIYQKDEDSENYILQSVQERYERLASITLNTVNNSIKVKIARTSKLEAQIEELQLAIAELGISQGGK